MPHPDPEQRRYRNREKFGELFEGLDFRKFALLEPVEGGTRNSQAACDLVGAQSRSNAQRTVEVEAWLRGLRLAPGTKSKIRKTLGMLFNHAIRWEFATRNPLWAYDAGSWLACAGTTSILNNRPSRCDVLWWTRLFVRLIGAEHGKQSMQQLSHNRYDGLQPSFAAS